MKLAHKLKFSFLILICLLTVLLLGALPALIAYFSLETVRSFFFILVILIFVALLAFLVIDQFSTLPIHEFEEQIKLSWKRHQALRMDTSSLPDELGDLYRTISGIVKELERSAKELREAKGLDILKFEFISIASHQLRTPLTGLRWAISLLLERPEVKLKKELSGFLESASVSVNQMIDLVNQLLQAAQLENQELVHKVKGLNLVDVIHDVVEKNRLFASTKDVTIEVVQKKTNIPTIMGNPDQMMLVFHNLVSNAIQYSHKKSRVVITLDYQDKFVVVLVKDQGIGIREQDKKYVFTKLYRSEEAMHMAPAGTGLGLYLAKAILAQHEGAISFTSKEGEGSTFKVMLPIKQKGELETFIQY